MFFNQRGVYRSKLAEYQFRLMEEGCPEDVAPCGKQLRGDSITKMLLRCIDCTNEKPQTINCGQEFARGRVALCNNCYANFIRGTVSGEEIELDKMGIFPEEAETQAGEGIEPEIQQQNRMLKIYRAVSWLRQNPCQTGAILGVGLGLVLAAIGLYNHVTQSSDSEIAPTVAQMYEPPSI